MLAGFSLVDVGASPQTLLAEPMDGASVEVANPDGGSYAIRADLNEGHTAGSVALELTGRKSASATEGVMPYSLYGDDGAGALRGEALPAGSHVLTMTAYEGSGGGRGAGDRPGGRGRRKHGAADGPVPARRTAGIPLRGRDHPDGAAVV